MPTPQTLVGFEHVSKDSQWPLYQLQMYWDILYKITLYHRHKLEMAVCTVFFLYICMLYMYTILINSLYTCIVICVMYLCMYTHFVYSYTPILYRYSQWPLSEGFPEDFTYSHYSPSQPWLTMWLEWPHWLRRRHRCPPCSFCCVTHLCYVVYMSPVSFQLSLGNGQGLPPYSGYNSVSYIEQNCCRIQ